MPGDMCESVCIVCSAVPLQFVRYMVLAHLLAPGAWRRTERWNFRAGHTDLRRMANFIFLDIPEAQERSALLHLVSVSPIVLVAANKGLLCRYHALRFSTQPLPIKIFGSVRLYVHL